LRARQHVHRDRHFRPSRPTKSTSAHPSPTPSRSRFRGSYDEIPRIAPSAALQQALLVDNPMRLYWPEELG
jgi:hypothetical protein